MFVGSRRAFTRHRVLFASASVAAFVLASPSAFAQNAGLGTLEAPVSKPVAPKKPAAPARANNVRPAQPAKVVAQPGPVTPAPAIPISSDAAIGSKAPVGSAPALAPSQASLNSYEPGSVVSDKVIRDIVVPTGDYNETAKFTPGFNSYNINGALGDSKSNWRGFADGQFNITFDGIPFGDENDPTHHSAAYFPAPFLGKVIIDRGPGAASTIGYATFGGTMALFSRDLRDKFGVEIQGSVGNNGTYNAAVAVQSGIVNGDTRALLQASYSRTDGALQYAHYDATQFLGKIEKQMGDVTATFFSTFGRENYNNAAAPTWAQRTMFGIGYGELNNNPLTQQYIGYNNSAKQTDMEYVKLEGSLFGVHFDNQLYTYAYVYPSLQNNGNDQTQIYPATGTVTSVKITNPASGCTGGVACTTTIKFLGVGATDITGYLKFNNYRAVGDILKFTYDVDAGFASGQLRIGNWLEHGDNGRYQQYYDYTTGTNYQNLPAIITSTGGATAAQQAIDLANASYKLDLNSHITNVQPYVEYEWKPFDKLSITPGFKYESFTRDHDGPVNQTTIQPVNYTKTYTASLPYLAVRYKVLPELTVYAQASKGFLAPTVSAYYVYDFNAASIQPEQTTNYQAGAVFKNNEFTASADVYSITAENFTVSQTLADGTSVLVSNGTARYQGVEAEATWAFGKRIGGWADGFGAYLSGSLSDAKYIAGPNAGLILPNAPKYTAAGGLVYDNGTVFGSLLTKFTGDQYGSGGQVFASPTVNPLLNHIGAYNTTDLVLGIRSDALKKMGFGEKAEFKVGVGNLFDNRAIVDIGGSPKTLTVTDPANPLTYTTLAGRTYYAGLKVEF